MVWGGGGGCELRRRLGFGGEGAAGEFFKGGRLTLTPGRELGGRRVAVRVDGGSRRSLGFRAGDDDRSFPRLF